MADPSQTTSPGDNPVRAEPTELRDFHQRIAVLHAQLEVQQAVSRALGGGPDSAGEGFQRLADFVEILKARREYYIHTCEGEIDVDKLPDEVVRSKLKELLENNKKLRADLREKAENTRKAIEILKTSDVPPSL